jgi:cytochrome c biogenesis protein CcdA
VLEPLEQDLDGNVEILRVDISSPSSYELLIRAEELFEVLPQDRGIPTLVVGEQILVGEEDIRQNLVCLLDTCIAEGGIGWPDIPGLDEFIAGGGTVAISTPAPSIGDFGTGGGDPSCEVDAAEACEELRPIWAAYFYQTGCQECSRAELDIEYVDGRYTQLIVDRFNIYDHADLAVVMGERVGLEELDSPVLFIGDDVLMGEAEITPQNLVALVEEYAVTGAPKVWESVDEAEVRGGLIDIFLSWGPLTIAAAGLVDGLNPCAFATLVFLVSYLSASERKGGQVLAVGGAFTLGVFAAYLLVGLGFYRVLDLMGDTLNVLSRWVYGFTALLCAVLAVVSLLDFAKARRGELEDMSLRLSDGLRSRVRAVIRRSQRVRAFVIGAVVTGVVVSLLELACTGQIYLPTIVLVISDPELRAQALVYLVLYNLLFILPLVVVFVLTYFGTTSLQFGLFLKRRAAAVKLGAALVFAALAVWLGISLLA